MENDFINLTERNAETEQLCCIIRQKPHPGIVAKRAWLAARLPEGHVFRKLRGNDCAFIEYAPLASAFVPVLGENYLYIYCLWVQGAPKGHGYGRELMEYCIADARSRGCSGICMLGAKSQKAWLSDQNFAGKFGFRTVDTAGEYELLALSFDGTVPCFAPGAKRGTVQGEGLTVFYSDQCPFIPQRVEKLREYCAAHQILAEFYHVDTVDKAKALPCPFNNWAVFWHGKFVTVNQIDGAALEKIMKKR